MDNIAARRRSASPRVLADQIADAALFPAALTELDALERAIEADLAAMAAELPAAPAHWIDANSLDLDLVAGQSTHLVATLAAGDAITATLGSELRALDLELQRLNTAIDRIHLLSDLRGCTTNMQTAMDQADWETAAGYVERHLHRLSDLDDVTAAARHPATTAHPGAATSLSPRLSRVEMDDLPPALQALFPHQSAIETDMALAEAVLDRSRDQLKAAIAAEFARATDPALAVPDTTAVLRCVALFPRIGEHELGLQLFGDYLANMLSTKSREAARSLETLDSSANLQLLTKIYENIAHLLDQNGSMISSKYGPGRSILLAQRLYQEGASLGIWLMDAWCEKRRLAQLLNMANQGVTVSARELDHILTELVMILQRSDMFMRFAKRFGAADMRALRTYIASHTPADASTSAQAPRRASSEVALLHRIESDRALSPETGLPLQGDLESAVKELSNHYLGLEDVYLRTNVSRALDMDAPMISGNAATAVTVGCGGGSSGPLLSSCVDDVFFLLKKCSSRALATRDLDIACTLLQGFESTVDNDFAAVLQMKVDGLVESFESDPKPDVRVAMMLYINNLQQIASYTPKFLSDVERDIQVLVHQPLPTSLDDSDLVTDNDDSSTRSPPRIDPKLAALIPKRREKVSFSLSPFSRLAQSVAAFVHTKLEGIFATFLRSKVSALLRELHTQYQMDEDTYTAMTAANAYIGNNARFTSAFSSLLANSKNELLTTNLNGLFLVMVSYWISEWEKIVIGRRFSQYGALYLERDVRSFSTYVTAEAQRTAGVGDDSDLMLGGSGAAGSSLTWSHALRERLAGIHQLITLLTLGEPREVYDYWGPRAIVPVAWKYGAAQVRSVLALRVEFEADEVAALKL
ncbi:COG4 transport protein-domain-containing protein [Blastocladiella britannica]|nr:COG4 transport protein-domain-containing protein [Blastocladiella britannica]